MSNQIKSPVELEIDQLAACNVGGRIRAAIYMIGIENPGVAMLQLEELLCFIEQRDLPEEKGVDAAVAETVSREIMQSIAQQPQCVYAVTSDFYWGRGTDLEGAIASCYKSGSRGSREAVIYIYTGPQEELDKITVDGGAAIHYPQTVTSNRVGKVKLPMKQKEGK